MLKQEMEKDDMRWKKRRNKNVGNVPWLLLELKHFEFRYQCMVENISGSERRGISPLPKVSGVVIIRTGQEFIWGAILFAWGVNRDGWYCPGEGMVNTDIMGSLFGEGVINNHCSVVLKSETFGRLQRTHNLSILHVLRNRGERTLTCSLFF